MTAPSSSPDPDPDVDDHQTGGFDAKAHHPRFRKFQLQVLVSTWMAYFGLYFCRKTFYAVKAVLGEEIGLTATHLGDIEFFYLLAYTLGQFASAGLGARFGPRRLLLGGMALSIACNVVFGFADSVATFTVFMTLNGFAQSAGWPACIGTLSAWIHRRERGSLMGLWATCYQVGGMAATAWASWWLHEAGHKNAFFASSAFVTGVWGLVWWLQRNRPEDRDLPALPEEHLEDGADGDAKTSSQTSPWTSQLIVNILTIGVFYFGVKFIRYALWSWLPFVLKNNFDVDAGDAGYLSTLFDLFGALGTITAGLLSDRLFGSKRAPVALLMLLGMTVATLGLYLTSSMAVSAFVACTALVGFMLYGPDSLLTGAAAIDVGDKRTALVAAGVINGMGSIGSMVQAPVIGRLYDDAAGDLTPILVLLIAASMSSLLAVGVLWWRSTRGLCKV